VVGAVGEVDPRLVEQIAPSAKDRRIASVEIDLDVLRDSTKVQRRPLEATSVSRFPSSDLDLAFVAADELSVEALLDAVGAGAGDLLEAIRLFDVYRGPGVEQGSRSLAVRCRLVADDRTLNEAELATVRQSMIDSGAAIGAVLR
jgi:phenylalanyl-tRNA synthetase beta chain